MTSSARTTSTTAETEQSLQEGYTHLAKSNYEEHFGDHLLRLFDVTIALFSLLLLSPLVLIIAIVILISSGKPVFYRGLRVGKAGTIFTMFKFRTLPHDAELRFGSYYGPELTERTQAEVTVIGKLIRVCHLDEIPQLWNVLKGDMSIVGPRPIRPTFFEQLCEHMPQYWQRLVVRPGLTGFAQLRMTRETSWAEKLAHDLEYIADRSVRIYLRIALRTIGRVVVHFVSAPFRLS